MCRWLSRAGGLGAPAQSAPTAPAVTPGREQLDGGTLLQTASAPRPEDLAHAPSANTARQQPGTALAPFHAWRGAARRRKSAPACRQAFGGGPANCAAQQRRPAELAGLQGSVDGGFVLGCGRSISVKQRLMRCQVSLFTMAAVSEISAPTMCGQSAFVCARLLAHHGGIALGSLTTSNSRCGCPAANGHAQQILCPRSRWKGGCWLAHSLKVARVQQQRGGFQAVWFFKSPHRPVRRG